MLPHRSLTSCLALTATLLLGLTQTNESQGVTGCRPPSPNPCAADGTCHPKRETWGHFHTRWRAWPGDPTDQQQTAEDALRDIPADELQEFQRPQPREEELRGPAKPPKARTNEEAPQENAEQPAAPLDPLSPLEGLIEPELPGFDPQGNLPASPSADDAPPALPESLMRISKSLGNKIPPLEIPPHKSQRSPQPVVRVNHESRQPIQLVNPAAAMVELSDQQLQHALYIEATDEAAKAHVQ